MSGLPNIQRTVSSSALIPDAGISVVVPVFNSEATLPDLVRRLAEVLPRVATEYELLLVHDGGCDASWEKICELAQQFSWVRGIRLMRNYGQHNALLCGIRAAQYPVTVTMDDDGQNPPEEIPKLLRTLQEGYDLVFGTPETQQHGLWRNLASRLTKRAIQSALGAETGRQVSAFRAFNTNLRNAFADYHDTFVSLDVLLSWGAARVGSVRVRHDARKAGESNYTLHLLILHAVNMITCFSTLPLQLASIIGFAFTIFGVGVLGFVLASYFIAGNSVAGFPFLASIIAIFSGAQLFALGIMGEYLARIHFRSMKKPAYAIAETASPPLGDTLVVKPRIPTLESE